MPRVINNLFNSFSDIGGIGRIRDDKAGINNVFTGGVRGLITGIHNEANKLGAQAQSGFKDMQENLARFMLDRTAAQVSTAADIATNTDLGRVVDIISTFMGAGFVRAVGQKAIQNIAQQGLKVYAAQGAKAFQNFVTRAASNLKSKTLIKNAPQATKDKIASGVNRLKADIKGSIDDTISNFTKRANDPKLSADERSFARMVRDNAEKIKNLADDLGVKSKKEIPNIIKFIKQTGDIMKNAPINIKRAAKGLGPVGIGATGLSLFDLWQAFKEGGDNLIPTLSRDVAMTGATMIPGGNLARILYGTLGYVSGDKLGRWAQRKLGMTPNVDESLQAEYDSGMAYPDLAGTIRNQMSGVNETALGNEEFPIGLSGRKYHVVGDRIYSFDTGRPVPVAQAIDDINQNINYINQQYQDKIAVNEQALQQVAQAEQSGYQVNPEYKQQLVNQSGQLLAAVQKIARPISVTDYDDSSDIVSQVQTDNGIVSSQQQSIQAPQLASNEELNQLYEQIFNTVAQRTYDSIDQYISPKALAVDYNQYMLQVAAGQAPYMNINDYVEYRKLNMMPQAASAIQEQANSIFQNYLNREENMYKRYMDAMNYGLEVRKQNEVERAGLTDNIIDAYKAEETARHNLQQESLSSRGYDIEQQRADTAAQTEKRQQKLLPYQQASYATEALMNAGFSDVPIDTILNSNPELFGQVYPGTQSLTPQQAQAVKAQQRRQQVGQILPFQNIKLPQINFSQLRNR